MVRFSGYHYTEDSKYSQSESTDFVAERSLHTTRSIPPTPGHRYPSRRCVVCSARGVRRETRYECVECRVYLHLPHCFHIYHERIRQTIDRKTIHRY